MAAARVGNGRRILCGMHGKTAARTAGTSCLTRACLRHAFAPIRPGHTAREGRHMVLIIVVLLIVLILGGLGFALHVLWWVALAALVIWLLGPGGAAAPPVPACCSRSPVDRPGSCLASFGTPLEKRRGRTQHFGLPGISGELARLARIPRPRPRAGLSLRTRAVMVP